MAKIKIEKATDDKLKKLGVSKWSSWECEPSSFDWEYDMNETAYVKEGRVTVKTDEETVEIKAGDIVTFPAGLQCKWIVHETIRKVYTFN